MTRMQTRPIVITAQATGEKTTAELLVCPSCRYETFLVYTPAGMTHVHFQCAHCGVTFCDGCAKEVADAPH